MAREGEWVGLGEMGYTYSRSQWPETTVRVRDGTLRDEVVRRSR